MTPPPDLGALAPGSPLAARAAALELLGAYTAGLSHAERAACLDRVVGELSGPAAARALVAALAEYAATFADLAGRQPAALVRSLARVDLG